MAGICRMELSTFILFTSTVLFARHELRSNRPRSMEEDNMLVVLHPIPRGHWTPAEWIGTRTTEWFVSSCWNANRCIVSEGASYSS
ncbi:hypothetical protein Mapa_012289 [Marchantia paleacea]|nr:hypothetical protein Mapa_012289 [Marchantia paleacea]